eukprot:CAMPEP_0119488754 /NCGR_PEP_ID=MMETSP1344-20130328/14420_1 /TAXON_ID=236787 /ORGANISM="Florenciella parvula, Strain CCMP2471" /LENGTH=54 /DNA_ID=CAMNT_0007523731 /DNA_START=96 /DNA_END=260 /DNA_ORIENTATION=-
MTKLFIEPCLAPCSAIGLYFAHSTEMSSLNLWTVSLKLIRTESPASSRKLRVAL